MTYTGSPERQSQSTSAVASSIWDMYEKGGKSVLPGETFDFLIIDCEVRANTFFHYCIWNAPNDIPLPHITIEVTGSLGTRNLLKPSYLLFIHS
jgi:hypothetical protein